jgi:hypothetical protein
VVDTRYVLYKIKVVLGLNVDPGSK